MALRSNKTPAWPVWALLCLAPQAHAARVLSVAVHRQGSVFLIGMRLRVAAPPAAVFRALQDYAALPRYTADVRSVRTVPLGPPGRVLLFTIVHSCVLFFCKTMHLEQRMTAMPDAHGGVLRSVLLTPGSDFREGRGRWTVRACNTRRAHSCLEVRIRLVPDFWVPPLIGPWLIRRSLREQARLAAAGLQRLAQRPGRRPAPEQRH